MQSISEHAADRLTVGAEELTFRVTGEASGGALTAVEVLMPPGGGPPALHRHEPFELYRVEEGELAFYLAGASGAVERTVAGEGAVVAIKGGREHTIRNESDADARAFVVLSPAGGMERFARAAGALAAAGAVTADQVMNLAAEHGIEITRPLEAVR